MQPLTTDETEEITFFIIEGTHRLATISMNDYGFLMSARMALTYMAKARHYLDAKRGFDGAFFAEVRSLQASATSITREYTQFESFCTDCERFEGQETKNWIEWVSKLAVRAISRGYKGTVSQLLAYKIRTFHSRVCSILTDK